jgi:hypothetical protein
MEGEGYLPEEGRRRMGKVLFSMEDIVEEWVDTLSRRGLLTTSRALLCYCRLQSLVKYYQGK